MLGIGRPDIHFLKTGTDISFDNAGSTIDSTTTSFGDAKIRDEVKVIGSTSNNTTFTVTSVATNELGVTPAPTDESAGAQVVLASARGVDSGSMKDIMADGVLRIYSGSQPANADAAVAGTLLVEITVDGGAFVHGAQANGLYLDDASSGAISKPSGVTWKGTAVATGTAGWARWCANPSDTGGSSTTLARIDMSVGTSNADLILVSTTITAALEYSLNNVTLTRPYQYGA